MSPLIFPQLAEEPLAAGKRNWATFERIDERQADEAGDIFFLFKST